ncbi:MAG: DUF2214 family protein [Bacteroidota bacterium]
MSTLILVRYLHFIGILLVFSMVVAELVLVKRTLTRAQIKKIAVFDGIYGAASIITVLAGLSLWFWVGKPPEFYTGNHVFYTKIGLFILVGLISLYPTIFFVKNRKGDLDENVDIPKNIIRAIRIELAILFVIPMLASLMAYGIG